MCSIGEDDYGDEGGAHAMIKESDTTYEIDSTNKIPCKKCNKNLAVVKLSFRDPECKHCFLANARHKFRATLGSSKLLPKNSEVIIFFDGSDASIVLVDMLFYAQSQNTFKRLHCSAKLLYIDEDFGHNLDLKQIDRFLKKYSFESYIVSIGGNGNLINFQNIVTYIDNPLIRSEEKKFQNEFENIKSVTSQQDFLDKKRKSLLKKAADNMGIKFVFLPDISSDIAVTLLTDISLGRGAAMAEDVSLCDNRYEHVKFIRPLKDLTNQEVENYLKFCDSNGYALPDFIPFGSNLGNNASIKNLTKDFIDNLQNGFSSTVSTIFRMGDKITSKNLKENSNLEQKLEELKITSTKCILCNSDLDFIDSNTLLAIEFSKLTSENTTAENLQNLDILEKRAWEILYGNNDQTLKQLCYGCRNLYNDCGNILFL